MAKRKKAPKKEFDTDELIGHVRELLSEEATEQSWLKLLLYIESIPQDAAAERAMLLDYIEGSMDHWDAKLRLPLFSWWKAKKEEQELDVFKIIGNFEDHPLLTIQDAERYAPDRKAFTTSKGIAKASKWDSFGKDENCLWGDASGSQGTYSVWVNVREDALDCNCPSRKRPCKHALGLLQLHAQALLPQQEAPSGHMWEAQSSYYSSWE